MKERLVVTVCLAVLFGIVFFPVLFQDRQFSYRDAAHFYYPLFEHIQAQWHEGRVPLWNPYENSGSPLLANPTSSVLYPGKVIFFLPIAYPTAYRIYVLAHVLLCAATAYGMARHWGASVSAAGLGGLSYAFSGPVLIQHANVVFLVGAAWIPLALLCADQALRQKKWAGAVGLGIVLALQVLGGDPQAAYLCGALAALYALGLYVADRRVARAACPAVLVTTGGQAARGTPRVRWHCKRVVLLVAAVTVGVALSFVQIVPTWRLTRDSGRAFAELPRTLWELPLAWLGRTFFQGEAPSDEISEKYVLYDAILGAGPPTPHNVYDFSTEPWRWAELLWPNISGRQFPRNSRWINGLPDAQAIWTPSLYLGVVPLVLGLSAFGLRRTAAPERWLSAITVFGLLGSLGSFGGVWLLRLFFGEQFAGRAGDEVGGLYWLLTVLLPTFVNFRFPAKLLVLTAVGMSGLAAVGWDRLIAGNNRTARTLLLVLVLASGAGLLGALGGTHVLDEWLSRVAERAGDAHYGPLDVKQARLSIQTAFLQSTLVAISTLWLVRLLRRESARRWVPAAILILVTADLAVANGWMVATAPQSDFETVPHALEVIRQDNEAEDPDEPFRIFRPGVFAPVAWSNAGSDDRPAETLRWSRNTLMPKYGLAYGIEDADVLGTMTLYDYEFFFGPWPEAGTIHYPRLSYDLWNVKYFILPVIYTSGMVEDEYRTTVQLAEPTSDGKEPLILYKPPRGQHGKIDYQIVRNPTCFPRAWLVHQAVPIPPVVGDRRDDRRRIVEPMVVHGEYDLRRTALVETDDRGTLAELAELSHRQANPAGDRCRFLVREPDRVELEVETTAPALLVVSDTYYPEWQARVDDQPTPILRTNRMMRGVVVPAGTHRVVFTYKPASFWWSAGISAAAWTVLAVGTSGWAWRRVRRPQ